VLGDRYVVLALVPPERRWLRELLALEPPGPDGEALQVVVAGSAEELGLRLASGRAFSAVVVDGHHDALSQDLVASCHRARCPVIVVSPSPWASGMDLGAQAMVAGGSLRHELPPVLRRCALPVPAAGICCPEDLHRALRGVPPPGRGVAVAVCGSGGTGASTVAMATAQGLATGGLATGGPVVLADLARRADQAVLHGAGQPERGLGDLLMYRPPGPGGPGSVLDSCLRMPERGYWLLPGLPERSAWAAVRPQAVGRVLALLASISAGLVLDIHPDWDGEKETGFLEVEERNAFSRAALASADVIVAVGLPGMKGAHALACLAQDLEAGGVPPSRTLLVMNRGDGIAAGPDQVQLPDLPEADLVGHGRSLPTALVAPLTAAVGRVLARSGRREAPGASIRLVARGTLGHFLEDEPTRRP